MHSVTKGIENGSDFAIDLRIVPPDIAHRKGNIFGKSSRPVYAYALRICAQMPAARQTIAAAAAYYMTLAADDLTRMKIVYICADINNFADYVHYRPAIADKMAEGIADSIKLVTARLESRNTPTRTIARSRR